MARQKAAPVAKMAEPEKIEEVVGEPIAEEVKVEDPATEEVKVEAPTTEEVKVEDQVAEEVKVDDPKASSTMAMVRNLRKTFFYQPTTGLRIDAEEVKELRDDSWLELQIAAGLLERVN